MSDAYKLYELSYFKLEYTFSKIKFNGLKCPGKYIISAIKKSPTVRGGTNLRMLMLNKRDEN